MSIGKMNRRRLVGLAAMAALSGQGMVAPRLSAAAPGQVVTEDGRVYTAYVPATAKYGQFYAYTCEFDAAWVVLNTFGYDVPFEEQLAIVGHDQSVEPYWEETPSGFVIYGGDIISAYSGDYTANLLARASGKAMQPLFEKYDLPVQPIATREAISATLDAGGLIWIKATVDFLPWQKTTWITPDGEELTTVLGNDHAVVIMGYNDNAVVIRDPLGPTSTNWNRAYEYEVPWATFMDVWGAHENDGLAVFPAGTALPDAVGDADSGTVAPAIAPVEVTGSA